MKLLPALFGALVVLIFEGMGTFIMWDFDWRTGVLFLLACLVFDAKRVASAIRRTNEDSLN